MHATTVWKAGIALGSRLVPVFVLAHCGPERTPAVPMVVAAGTSASTPSAVQSSSPPSSATRFHGICVGYHHTCATTESGAVYCWGTLKSGLDDVSVTSSVPTRVPGIENAVQIACAFTKTCVRLKDGSVTCWDLSERDQSEAGKLVTVAVRDAVDLTGMDEGACAISRDGNVTCWSDTWYKAPRTRVVEGNAEHFVPAIEDELCFLRRDRRPVCLLPFPTHQYRPPASPSALKHPRPSGSAWTHLAPIASQSPAAEPLMEASDVVDFARWIQGPCLLRADGSIRCSDPMLTQALQEAVGSLRIKRFLSSSPDQLCVRTTEGQTRCARWIPGPLTKLQPELGPVQSLSQSGDHGCAVRDDGSALCWGDTLNGQLGDGVHSSRTKPYAVGIDDAIDISAAENRSCAVRKNGALWCWGTQGNLCPETPPAKPREVDTGGTVTRVVLGAYHSAMNLCVGDDHRNWSCRIRDWYRIPTAPSGTRQLIDFSVLGDDGLTWRVNLSTPQGALDPHYFARAGARLTSLSPSGECGVDRGGHIVCGAFNGSQDPRQSLKRIPSASSFEQVTSLLALGEKAAVCGRTKTGLVECWATPGLPIRPVDTYAQTMKEATRDLKDVVDLAGDFTRPASAAVCAVTKDGKVLCWGENDKGQLGDGTMASRSTTSLVGDLPPASRVATSGAHVCALTVTGSVYCWGNDRCGEVGAGVPGFRATAPFYPPKDNQ